MPNKLYTVREIAELAGVSTSAMRAWERRFAFFSPNRTQGGHRLYTINDLKIFWYIKRLQTQGMGLKEIAELGRENLLSQATNFFNPQVIEENVNQDNNENYCLLHIEGKNCANCPAGMLRKHGCQPQKITNNERSKYKEVIKNIQDYDFDLVLKKIDDFAENFQNPLFFADMSVALMRSVEDACSRSELSVAGESFIRHHLRFYLLRYLYSENLFPHKFPENLTAICATIPNDTQEFDLLRIALYLRRWGFKVVYLGANIPISAMHEVVKAIKPNLLCLSISKYIDKPIFQKHLSDLEEQVTSHVATVIWGTEIGPLFMGHANSSIFLTKEISEFQKFCRFVARRTSSLGISDLVKDFGQS